VERAVLSWLDHHVVGLDLCPFAAAARRGVRVARSSALSFDAAQADVLAEATLLAAQPLTAPATTLVVLPVALVPTYDIYLDLVEHLSSSLLHLPLDVVPFHPLALFSEGDSPPNETDPAQFATRSPLPLVHLLRNCDVAEAERLWDGHDVVAANKERLRGVGWAALVKAMAGYAALADG